MARVRISVRVGARDLVWVRTIKADDRQTERSKQTRKVKKRQDKT